MQKFFNGILLVPFFVLSLTSLAQVNSVSPYSRLGLGEFQSQNYARALGFGGANFALPDAYNVNFTNPASYSRLDLTTFHLGFETSVVEQEQRNPDMLVKNYNTGLRYFSFGLPVTDWWGSAIGLQPYTSRGYDISRQHPDAPDGVDVQERFLGTGGLNNLYWGNAFDVAEGLSLGINTSFIFGKLRKQNQLNWDNDIPGSVTDQQINVKGLKLGYAAQYSYTFKNGKEFSLSAGYNNSTALSADVDYYAYITSQGGVPIDSVVRDLDRDISLPSEFSIGLSYGAKDRNTPQYSWAVAADLHYYQGSEFEDFDGAQNLVNSYKAELGGFLVPALAFENINRNGNYLGQIEYRLGGYYEQTPFEVDDTQLSEYGITFGLGLPVRQRGLAPGEVKRSVINTALILGRRGSLEQGLIRESFLKVFVGITLNDKWFIKYKYR